MKVCPQCQKAAKISERIEADPKTKKNWLITFCAKCSYNYELEEYNDKVLSPQEEMDCYPEDTKKYWA